jgi:hypothetical protein
MIHLTAGKLDVAVTHSNYSVTVSNPRSVINSTAEGDANEVGDHISDAVECLNPVGG